MSWADNDRDDKFWPISEDTWTRAQWYDCKKCRAVTIDPEAHAAWHAGIGGTE